MNELKAALIQIDTAWENPPANRRRIEELMAQIDRKVDLILLPETFTTGFSMKAAALAEEMSGETVAWMTGQATLTDAVVAGSLIIAEDKCFYNRFIAAFPDGTVHCYDKRHLFPLAGEDRVFTRGEERLVFEIGGWKIAPFICYDLRFPCWSRNYKAACDCLVYAANWPASRSLHWENLLKARAIENQAYCLGINRTGTDGSGVASHGGSLACDYDGLIISEAGEAEGITLVALSRRELLAYREKFPWLKDADEPVL